MTDDEPSARPPVDRKGRRRRGGICTVVTGQVGLDKKPFLEQVVTTAAANGREVRLVNVGDRMYAEGPDIVPGRILDLPKQRLTTLRRSVFKDILALAATDANLIVNTTQPSGGSMACSLRMTTLRWSSSTQICTSP